MRRLVILGILVLGGCDATRPADVDLPAGISGYFPPGLFQQTVNCGPLPLSKPRPVLSRFEDAWYSKHLRAAGEQPLSFAPGSPEVLRFTWLPSFHAPVVVRVEWASTGGATLTATMLSGQGGYEPGEVSSRVTRVLTRDEVERLLVLRQAALRRPPVDCAMMLDGAVWIIEAAGTDGYHYVNAQSPETGPVHDLGLAMLGFTGWEVEPIY